MKKLLILVIATLSIFLIGILISWGSNTEPEVELCNLEPETGPCKARMLKYYFNQDSKSCQSFIWGGCQGVVPFNKMDECENSCPQ